MNSISIYLIDTVRVQPSSMALGNQLPQPRQLEEVECHQATPETWEVLLNISVTLVEEEVAAVAEAVGVVNMAEARSPITLMLPRAQLPPWRRSRQCKSH